jgi:membrane protease subunit HflC
MNRTIGIITLVIFALLIGAGAGATYVVDETEQVVITQFGDPVGEPITEPGLKFKIPFIQTVHRFDERFLEWNGDANEVPTKDKRFIEVDTYARWRITDPLVFYQRLRNEAGAQSRLDDIIDGATRDAVASHELLELVRASNRTPVVETDIPEDEASPDLEKIATGRPKIMSSIEQEARRQTEDLGIQVLDVRFKRINYNDQVRKKVYDRMIAERERIAERYRSEGRGEAAQIEGTKERELDRILSEAERKAEEKRGTADAKATDIYAEAYNRDPAFFEFLRTTESYADAFEGRSWMLMSTESDFMKYLKEAAPAE